MPRKPREPFCGNEDAHGPRSAVAHITFPDGRYRANTACRSCLRWSLSMAMDEGYEISIRPVRRIGDG